MEKIKYPEGGLERRGRGNSGSLQVKKGGIRLINRRKNEKGILLGKKST